MSRGRSFARRAWRASDRVDQKRYDALFDLLGGEGLAEVTSGAGGEGFDYAGFTAFRGDHHDWNTFGALHSGDTLEKLQAVHYGHIDVAQDEVERAFLNFRERFGAVAGLDDLSDIQPSLPESSLDDLPHNRRIIHNEDFEFLQWRSPDASLTWRQ